MTLHLADGRVCCLAVLPREGVDVRDGEWDAIRSAGLSWMVLSLLSGAAAELARAEEEYSSTLLASSTGHSRTMQVTEKFREHQQVSRSAEYSLSGLALGSTVLMGPSNLDCKGTKQSCSTGSTNLMCFHQASPLIGWQASETMTEAPGLTALKLSWIPLGS